MRRKKSSLFSNRSICYAALALLMIMPSALSAYSDRSPIPWQQAKDLLEKGNARFMDGLHKVTEWSRERIALKDYQQPFAVVLSCSDSRVPPEIVFDQSLGKIFVIRVAGNVAEPFTTGSIEYGAMLYSNLIVVMGHDKCGAVDAVVCQRRPQLCRDSGSEEPPPNLRALLRLIEPAVDKVLREHPSEPRENLVARSVKENVCHQMKQLLSTSPKLRDLTGPNGPVRMIGGVYSFDSGRVTFFDPACPSMQQ
jgi:carbonic anhydrase